MATHFRCMGGLMLMVNSRYRAFKLMRNFCTAVASVSKIEEKIHPDWIFSDRSGGHPAFRKIDLTFENVKEAYKSKSNAELVRALLVFRLLSIEPIVSHQEDLFDIAEEFLGRSFLEKSLELTFYGQFVAGPDIESIKPVIARYRKFGVKAILDYSVEDVGHAKNVATSILNAFAKADSNPIVRQYRAPVPDVAKGVLSARTYAYENEKVCDKNMTRFIECIDAVAETTDGGGFSAIKVTALGKPELLMNISEVLVRMEDYYRQLTEECIDADAVLRSMSENQARMGLTRLGIPICRDDSKHWFTWLDPEERVDLFEWKNLLNADIHKVLSLPTDKPFFQPINLSLSPLVAKIDPDMDEHFRNMIKRLNEIVEHAKSRSVRIMIDAEHSYFQPAINRLVIEMMRHFNKDKAVIFNTYQAYKRDSLQRVQLDLALSGREDFYFGCKLVRGAYLEQERARAADLNYPDPIWASSDETTASYVRIFEEFMKQAKMRSKGKVNVMVATHNEKSVRMAVLKMKELGINPDDKIVCFGQLMGMSDHVSFPLAQAGFSVYKYVPYGPLFDVMPYLMRRAQENSSIFDKAVRERLLLRSELQRRIVSGQIC